MKNYWILKISILVTTLVAFTGCPALSNLMELISRERQTKKMLEITDIPSEYEGSLITVTAVDSTDALGERLCLSGGMVSKVVKGEGKTLILEINAQKMNTEKSGLVTIVKNITGIAKSCDDRERIVILSLSPFDKYEEENQTADSLMKKIMNNTFLYTRGVNICNASADVLSNTKLTYSFPENVTKTTLNFKDFMRASDCEILMEMVRSTLKGEMNKCNIELEFKLLGSNVDMSSKWLNNISAKMVDSLKRIKDPTERLKLIDEMESSLTSVNSKLKQQYYQNTHEQQPKSCNEIDKIDNMINYLREVREGQIAFQAFPENLEWLGTEQTSFSSLVSLDKVSSLTDIVDSIVKQKPDIEKLKKELVEKRLTEQELAYAISRRHGNLMYSGLYFKMDISSNSNQVKTMTVSASLNKPDENNNLANSGQLKMLAVSASSSSANNDSEKQINLRGTVGDLFSDCWKKSFEEFGKCISDKSVSDLIKNPKKSASCFGSMYGKTTFLFSYEKYRQLGNALSKIISKLNQDDRDLKEFEADLKYLKALLSNKLVASEKLIEFIKKYECPDMAKNQGDGLTIGYDINKCFSGTAKNPGDGTLTIGYGINICDPKNGYIYGEKFCNEYCGKTCNKTCDNTCNRKITKEKAEELLRYVLVGAKGDYDFVGEINKLNIQLKQHEFDAILSLIFNAGTKYVVNLNNDGTYWWNSLQMIKDNKKCINDFCGYNSSCYGKILKAPTKYKDCFISEWLDISTAKLEQCKTEKCRSEGLVRRRLDEIDIFLNENKNYEKKYENYSKNKLNDSLRKYGISEIP
ncbi:hypothetical protein R83H12_00502 [Fibrobacteria bacterium R8-3-H12]